MNYELITIIITIIGTGAGVVGFISPRLSKIDEDINALKERMGRLEIDLNERMGRLETDLKERMAKLETSLKERMARLEGVFEGFAGRAQ